MSDNGHELRQIAHELRLIRQALERISPPPEKPEPRTRSAYERRGVIVA